MIPFVNHLTGQPLKLENGNYYDSSTNQLVAKVVDGLPRFIKDHQDYAVNFGYQWKKWSSLLSDARNPNTKNIKLKTLLKRTRFDEFNMEGKTFLECGCGGGDDTEVMLQFPFSEIHSFDISTSVERSARFLSDSRLRLSQASIFEILYADQSFDFVFCHRVLQHTPDPHKALRCVARKVKQGGVLFVHSYHKTFNYLMHFKYKYRFITKNLSIDKVEKFLDRYAPVMHRWNEVLYKSKPGRFFAYNFIPLEYTSGYADFTREQIIDLEKLVTFDALTPKYDKPMSWAEMKKIVEEEGFQIKFFNSNPKGSPIYLTAVRS